MVAQTALVKPVTNTQLARPQMILPAKPSDVVQAVKETQELLREVLEEGVDFGVMPGTETEKGKKQRKVLFKPGAEKIALGFGCHAEFDEIEREIDHGRTFEFTSEWEEAPRPWPNKAEATQLRDAGKGRWRKINDNFVWQVPGNSVEKTMGLYRYVFKAKMVRFDGIVVGEGIGACSTLESKYRSRPHDVENTVLKMAQKRAFLAATLSAFGLSDGFTQDVIDDEDAPEVAEKPAQRAKNDGVVEGVVLGASTPAPKAAAPKVDEEALAKKKAGAVGWAFAYVALMEKAGTLPADADDDIKKGAMEAFKTVKEDEKNQRGVAFLATVDAKLAAGVKATETSIEAHLHGLTIAPTDDDVAALKYLEEQRPKPATTPAQ